MKWNISKNTTEFIFVLAIWCWAWKPALWCNMYPGKLHWRKLIFFVLQEVLILESFWVRENGSYEVVLSAMDPSSLHLALCGIACECVLHVRHYSWYLPSSSGDCQGRGVKNTSHLWPSVLNSLIFCTLSWCITLYLFVCTRWGSLSEYVWVRQCSKCIAECH